MVFKKKVGPVMKFFGKSLNFTVLLFSYFTAEGGIEVMFRLIIVERGH